MIEQKSINKEDQELAICEINEHGRLLSGNRRFCRMFGFTEKELVWHYLLDLYRYETDWKAYRACEPEQGKKFHFVARLKNRKGRSFQCSITREVSMDSGGRIVYRNSIQKLEDFSTTAGDVADQREEVLFPVYFNSPREIAL